jgi:hypothetical protein
MCLHPGTLADDPGSPASSAPKLDQASIIPELGLDATKTSVAIKNVRWWSGRLTS